MDSLRPIDAWFLKQDEPFKSCLYALRDLMNNYNEHITEEWKYGMPFYYYNGKMFCYLWTNKKTGQPYIGIMEGRNITHPLLVMDDRKRAKIMYINKAEDIPASEVKEILDMAKKFYK
ncbi:MAG: DUF1801 domain-containing protein [Chitinophagaceae bacterium]|nr:MAG: DUF1801 domain-containing protein [Chitinophagaceae bacterium]